MKKQAIKYSFLLLFILVNMRVGFSQNYIFNPSFEHGDVSGAEDRIAEGEVHFSSAYLETWESNLNLGSNSPDWFYSPNLVADGQTNGLGAHSLSGMIGMGNYEMIEQKYYLNGLNPSGNTIPTSQKFVLSFYLSTATNVPMSDDSYLRVYLSKRKLVYEGTYNCQNNFNNRIANSENSYEIILNLGNLQSNYPSGSWHLVEHEFNAPDNMKNLDWIAFQVVGDSTGIINGNPTEFPVCVDSYIFLDDVGLYKGCLNTCSRLDGTFDNIFINTPQIDNTTPLTITNIDNIETLDFFVYTTSGALVYTNSTSCINGITQDLYWDGKNVSGSHVANATYTYKIIVNNDCGENEYSGKFIKSQNYGGPLSTNFNSICSSGYNETPEPCCVSEPNLYINNEILVGPNLAWSEYILREKIFASTLVPGSSDEVRINGDAKVLFRAGQQITLGAGFNTKPGAEFIAEIESCDGPGGNGIVQGGGGSQGNNSSQRMKAEYIRNTVANAEVYPNPSSGEIKIINSLTETEGTLEVFNMQGKLVYSRKVNGENKTVSLNLSEFGTGIYYIKLYNKSESQTAKVLIQ